MADTDVIKSFLVALGFKVDEGGMRRFTDTIIGAGRGVEDLGAQITGTAAAVEAMAVRFADSMEQLYYAAQRTGSTATALRALDQGARRIGMSAGGATAALSAMAQNVRLNPGLERMLTGRYGIDPRGPTAMLDLADKLSSMPFFRSARIAGLFGIDPEQWRLIMAGRREMREEIERSRALGRQYGLGDEDFDRAHTFMNRTRDMLERFELLGMRLATDFLPIAEKVVRFVGQITDLIARADTATDGWVGRIAGLVTAFTAFKGVAGIVAKILAPAAAASAAGGAVAAGGAAAGGVMAAARSWVRRMLGPAMYLLTTSGNAYGQEYAEGEDARMAAYNREHAAPGGSASLLPTDAGSVNLGGGGPFATLEKAWGLPAGLLSRVRSTESGGNSNAVSPAGALGAFQFMPDTAKRYGINPLDPAQAAQGAAHYFHDLLEMFGGDVRKALAGYNAGEQNVVRAIARASQHPGSDWLQYMPKWETVDYVKKIMGAQYALADGMPFFGRGAPGAAGINGGVHMDARTTIQIMGGDPHATAQATAGALSAVHGRAIRDLKGAVDPLH